MVYSAYLVAVAILAIIIVPLYAAIIAIRYYIIDYLLHKRRNRRIIEPKKML